MSDHVAIRPGQAESATTGCTIRMHRSCRIVKQLPRELKGQLPSPAEISRILEDGK